MPAGKARRHSLPRCTVPTVYVVGGLGESSLSREPGGGGLVWPDLSTIMRGQLGQMRLAPDGVSPGPPDGVQLYASGWVEPYLGLPARQLILQLATRGWSVVIFPWDWRRSAYLAGQTLAARIRADIPAGDPCSIVGHSAGGLVARAAWTELVLTGHQGRVRRIVTLGSPHWGSYSLTRFFQANNRSIDLLYTANAQVGSSTFGWAPGITGYQQRDRVWYAQLGTTWPGLYDCLPTLGAPDAGADPNRELLYDASAWWPDARPSQTWLDYTRDVTGPWLRGAPSQPPSNVLTCCSGKGHECASRLIDPADFARGGGVGGFVDGDGTVTQAASELDSGTVHRYVCDHPSWFPALVANGEIVVLLDEDTPTPPPPPPSTVRTVQAPGIEELPGAVLPGWGNARSRSCAGGVCTC